MSTKAAADLNAAATIDSHEKRSEETPSTIHLSRWYAPAGFTGLGAIALLAAYSFYTALAGQRVFSLEVLDR